MIMTNVRAQLITFWRDEQGLTTVERIEFGAMGCLAATLLFPGLATTILEKVNHITTFFYG